LSLGFGLECRGTGLQQRENCDQKDDLYAFHE
jgi:hypothetical protein